MTLHDWSREAERHEPWVRRAAWIVLACGLLAFVVRGADRPPDPFFADAKAAAGGRTPLAGFEEASFRVHTAEGDILDWCALLAATDETRRRGLMEQTDLAGYDGMLFRFDQPVAAGFYMYRTVLPLSIAFFDEDGAFVSSADIDPCPGDEPGDCPTTRPERPIVHALEVPQGALAALGVGPDSTLAVTDGACS